MVVRSDGRGRCFPGGISSFRENEGVTLRREVQEETGLEIVSSRLLWTYHSHVYLPSQVAVFLAEAQGTPRDSWEGRVELVPRSELRKNLFAIHQPIADYLETGEMHA